MPYGRGVNLSRRIRNENERNRLRALAILIKPAGMGLLVRTEAEGKPEEAIIEDLEALQKQWEAIQLEAVSTRAPALLNRDDDFIQRVLRDMYGADVNRIVVDSSTGLKRVKQYLQNWSGGQTPQGLLIDHHRDRTPILEYFRVNAAVKEALRPRVDLPSGGYVIIEPTEALTVIDVNSGSFTRSATARETVLWTNCEAATEIARQLRLRNIAGVIVVDFIDMESRRDQLHVLEHFNKALKADKARPQIAQLTELGLVELTRKRQGQNVYELFGQTCPTCGGLGHIVHLPGETESRIAPPAVATEAPDRFVTSTPIRETRMPTARASEARDTTSYEGFSESPFEPETEFNSGNLVNHPSYNEIGDKNRRVRRRQRIGVNGPNGKEEPRVASSPMSYVSDQDIDIDSSDAEIENNSPGLSTMGSSKPHWAERGERKIPKLDPIKPVVEPPEIVSVEMSTDEQDVYALMGVSPLIRLNREVKNPKSVIVNVTLPGQAPTSNIEVEPPPISSTPLPKPRIEPVKIDTSPEPWGDVPTEPTNVSTPIPRKVVQPVQQVQPVQPPQPSYTDDSPSVNDISSRRRRRRSSAMDSDSDY
jgi:ribonuclease E